MKAKLFLAAVAGSTIFIACTIIDGQSNIKYTTLPAEGRNMPVKAFASIRANGVFNIILQHGATESVVVKGQFPSDLKITNDGNTLIIMDTVKNHNDVGHRKTEIYVTYKELSAIETESVGQIKCLDTIKSPRFTFESDGVGESSLILNSDSVTASENGVGALDLSGKAHYATIEDNGVGALKARNFKVGILHASVSGVGAAKVYADSEIYLDVNGVGGLKYYGPAKVMEKTSSGVGKVEPGND